MLIPRPETELLVDYVLKFADSLTHRPTNTLTILDIGTGAGNIAISVAKNLYGHPGGGGIKIIATDVSKKALKIAQQNAQLHGVSDRIQFLQSDLLFDFDSSLITLYSSLIIVTNLPYIPTQRIPYLDSSVKDFEPHIALDGGEDGFELYRELFRQISDRTRKPGLKLNSQTGFGKLKLLIGEIDYTHGELARNEALKYFPQAEVEIKTDLAEKQRILLIHF